MLSRETRRRAVASYLGPVVALFAVAGIALIYWANRAPATVGEQQAVRAENYAVGTPGSVGTSGQSTPGGFDPQPRFDDTRDELENRGAGDTSLARPEPTLVRVQEVAAARQAGLHLDLRGVEVAEAGRDRTFWVHDGTHRVEVIAPEGARVPAAGERAHITGVVELDGATPRIRADRVEPAD